MKNDRPDARPDASRPDDTRPDATRPATTPARPRPAAQDDDNALESIGKAISTPIEGAAEPEEPHADKPPQPPGH
jgi:hypothetical protein